MGRTVPLTLPSPPRGEGTRNGQVLDRDNGLSLPSHVRPGPPSPLGGEGRVRGLSEHTSEHRQSIHRQRPPAPPSARARTPCGDDLVPRCNDYPKHQAGRPACWSQRSDTAPHPTLSPEGRGGQTGQCLERDNGPNSGQMSDRNPLSPRGRGQGEGRSLCHGKQAPSIRRRWSRGHTSTRPLIRTRASCCGLSDRHCDDGLGQRAGKPTRRSQGRTLPLTLPPPPRGEGGKPARVWKGITA
jgi:hypothetical protein